MMPSVLIIGAGPTGLVLALWLTKLGVKVRISMAVSPTESLDLRLFKTHMDQDILRNIDIPQTLF
jgi:threonine dehydrogenase-like Zn-dependent dehydrogenase